MKQKKLKITLEDFILANRRASRMEEIERHGRQVQSKRMVHKSKKTYDRNRLKRAVIMSDDGSFYFQFGVKVLQAFASLIPTTAFAAVPPLSSAGAKAFRTLFSKA